MSEDALEGCSLYNKVKTLPKTGNIVGMDKLSFSFPEDQIPDLQLEDEESRLRDGKIEFIRGRKGKIQVSRKNGYIQFTVNPAVYLYENNFYTVGYEDFLRMINEIEKEIGFSIKHGIVRILHPQATIEVNQKPQYYFNTLSNSPRLHRSEEKTTLYYKTLGKGKYKILLFYDKKKQAGKNIPEDFKDGEYLRFENQYNSAFIKNIAKKIGKSQILIQDLIQPDVYKLFINQWYKEHDNICKENQFIFNPKNIQSPSDFDAPLICMCIESLGGIKEFEKMLEATKPYINRPSDFFSKVRSRYRDICANAKTTQESPLLSELNSKIDFAYQNTLAEIENYAKNIN
ncbi:hypothetical protein SAMN05880574_11961 [Chryseobacterium sp. RU37D]|uniref:hypothetical protein n=1 Tax=Chryseobacterium sp. RU37D TaxID=1907397 RepID=UPI0009548D0D|nr:hypothetical protein [Chryseobacterium sp. RU37D]SIQ65441.1 hypothetical protein SAMN05880574_11961 [Chryseobacterium sp. RU37D]